MSWRIMTDELKEDLLKYIEYSLDKKTNIILPEFGEVIKFRSVEMYITYKYRNYSNSIRKIALWRSIDLLDIETLTIIATKIQEIEQK